MNVAAVGETQRERMNQDHPAVLSQLMVTGNSSARVTTIGEVTQNQRGQSRDEGMANLAEQREYVSDHEWELMIGS